MPVAKSSRYVTRPCAVCGTAFQGHRYIATRIYCGERCAALAKAGEAEATTAQREFLEAALAKFLTLREPLHFEETERRLRAQIEYLKRKADERKAA